MKLPIPKVIKSSKIFSKHGKTIEEDTLQLENDETYSYYSLHTTPYSVMTLAFTFQNKVVINYEYRHPSKSILLSLPGGCVDEGEDYKKAAEREFLEETGFIGHDFELIGSAYPFPGFSSQKTFYYRAYNAKKVEDTSLDPCEILKTELISLPDIKNLIRSGENVDGHLMTALSFHALKPN